MSAPGGRLGNVHDVTRLLVRAGEGDEAARAELAECLYDQLRALARAQMRHRGGHTLQPTALVHEAWFRLIGKEQQFESRGHFLAIAARAMRGILVDHARARGTAKRGGEAERQALDASVAAFEERGADLVALNDSLERLAAVDELAARIVELRFFGGASHTEIADATGEPLRTVERKWQMARGWLKHKLGE